LKRPPYNFGVLTSDGASGGGKEQSAEAPGSIPQLHILNVKGKSLEFTGSAFAAPQRKPA